MPRAAGEVREAPKTIWRTYRYRLYPTAAQSETLERWLDMNRILYNKALWWRQGAYERHNLRVTKKDQLHALSQLKRDWPEYRDMPRGMIEDVVVRVDKAFRDFFRRCKNGGAPGYPKHKGEGSYKSLTAPRSVEFSLDPPGEKRFGKLTVGKTKHQRSVLGAMRIRMHRPIPEGANVRRLTLKKEPSGKWYACVGWDTEVVGTENGRPPVGVDVGLSAFFTTSEGEKVEPSRHFKRSQQELRRKHRRLSRAKKGSNRRKRARLEVAKAHEQIRNRRRDSLHKLSRGLVDSHGLIALEKLKVQNMVKNRHLAGSIMDAGWSEFAHMLAYKAEAAGGEVVFVDPKNTSQECSGCGAIVEKTLDVRTHRCGCGLVLDRDHNAAINILNRANRAARARRGIT